MFKLLGALLAVYTTFAAADGQVHAKSGIRWRKVLKAESPGYFWSVIVIYAGLSLALLTIL
ncbi:MAG TPA: hypothetical protein VGE08_18695 [Steroidobacter sp.]|uniref:hypothetical protein n=1 Tax=Steroidobacter sp. TaxID=1978227 RepID=UPI002ED8009C